MDLVPLAGFFAGPGQGHDVLGEAGGDDDQPSQRYAAQCESWEVPRNTEDLKAKLLRPESAVEAVWPAML